MTTEKTHISVLYHECLEALLLQSGKTIIDGTFGAGGHSLGIAKEIGKQGTLISFDQDNEVFEKPIVQEIRSFTTFIPVVANFRTMEAVLHQNAIMSIDGVLLDLGLSSTQLEHSSRGFSFQKDEPLYMTFSATPTKELVTAEVIVNEWQETVIADVLYGFADETYSRRIAKAIVAEREKKRITTTGELIEIIKHAVPVGYQRGKTHFATRTFQALRMAVNDELGSAEEGIKSALGCLAKGGRLAVISFHSIEDRLVKHTLKSCAEEGIGVLVNKKPIIASDEERTVNPRSRSAKLRIIEKI